MDGWMERYVQRYRVGFQNKQTRGMDVYTDGGMDGWVDG
jgi:hypothetical protein